jgi:hypothetical protein
MSKSHYLFLFAFLLFASSCKKDHITRNTLTLQPTDNPNEVHLFVLANGVDQSDPTSTEIDGVAWTQTGIGATVRAVFKFDLSTVPQNAVIDSARLTLYSNPTPGNGNLTDANFGTNNTLLIQQVTSSWDPTTTNWTNQPPASTSGQIVIPSTTQKLLDLPNIDVTAMISNMVKNSANYGFFMRLQSEVAFNSRIFCSSKYSDPSKHPKLVVAYHY